MTITGTIEGWSFGGQKDSEMALVEIRQWGSLRLGNEGGYFHGAANLQITAEDRLNLSGTTDLSGTFAVCRSLTAIPGMETWDVSNVTTMQGMFSENALSTPHYDALLNGWAGQPLKREVRFGGGASRYSKASAAARARLVEEYEWDIVDGGRRREDAGRVVFDLALRARQGSVRAVSPPPLSLALRARQLPRGGSDVGHFAASSPRCARMCFSNTVAQVCDEALRVPTPPLRRRQVGGVLEKHIRRRR